LNANTNLVLYTEGKEENTLKTAVSVNASNNTINIYEIFSGSALPSVRSSKAISFSIVNGRKYILEMYRLARANGIRITDTLTGKTEYLEVYPTQAVHGSDKEVYAGGLQYDQFGIFWNGGTAPIIHELSCGYFGVKNPLLYIAGDSIMYGYGTNNIDKTFAHLVGAMTGGDYVVSPRGGGKIGGVLEKTQTECAIIKPKYVMVTIGTNQTPTISELQQLIDSIETIGSIPIINCIPCRTNGEQMAANNNILSMGVYSCRSDLATAIDPTASTLKADLSLYVDNGVHPNTVGFKRMADRVRIDLPFLF
jgi:lysophospholipase L1-like esterase